MTADSISLQKQYLSLSKNYEANKKLYESGMLSMQKLNDISIQKSAMNSKIVALRSQLQTLGINADKLKKATANFILYAHSGGRVSKLHLPLHTVVKVDESLISIVKEQAFYVESYLPLEFASRVKSGQKLVVDYNTKQVVAHVRQVLPKVDTQTQRIILLSSIDEKVDGLFINSFVQTRLYFDATKEQLAVEKSALSFFNNEWVVFVPQKEEKEAPYGIKVVKILSQDENFVAVDGLEKGEEYVSGKSYFVKSALLKSSLGDGD
jgi:multidrug resistance efflux pump